MSEEQPKLHFSRPPIIEAIIAFKFSNKIEKRWIQKLCPKLKKEYPTQAPLKSVSVNLEALPTGQPNPSVKVEDLGIRFTSQDRSGLLQVAEDFLSAHKLAPYGEWEELVTAAKQAVETIDQLAGIIPINNVATRYLNRIDVPCDDIEKQCVNFNEYFTLYSQTPPSFQDMTTTDRKWARVFEDKNQGYKYAINFSSVPPAIIDHLSFMLDIEVTSLKEPPQKRDDLWRFVEKLRQEKNKAFLAYLTKKTTGLFE